MLVSVFTSDLAVVSSTYCVRLIIWIWLLKLLSTRVLGTEWSQSLKPRIHTLVGGSRHSAGIYCVCVQLLVDVYKPSLMSKLIAACSNKPLTFYDTVGNKNFYLLLIQEAFASLCDLWSNIYFTVCDHLENVWKHLFNNSVAELTASDHCNRESTFSVECHLSEF